jgi:hypothetical protein
MLIDGIRFVWCATPDYEGNGVGRVFNMFAFLRPCGNGPRGFAASRTL